MLFYFFTYSLNSFIYLLLYLFEHMHIAQLKRLLYILIREDIKNADDLMQASNHGGDTYMVRRESDCM